MQKSKMLINVISNWANFLSLIVVSFIVSPIIVHKLGNENYGIWTLIISITGYFTVLDFGVNTAIVRYISKYAAQENEKKAREIYSTSCVFFFLISSLIIIFTVFFAYYFVDIFSITSLPRKYIYAVFLIIGVDLAFGLFSSVVLGALMAMQKFVEINIFSILTTLIKNILIVYFLLNEYSILSLAIIHTGSNLLKYILQYIYLKYKFKFLYFEPKKCTKEIFKKIYTYSIYSFLIAVSVKFMFYTDSIVIGFLISVSEVTFYAIPSTIVDYLQKIVWAVIAVLVPIISSNDAIGKNRKNAKLYLKGTKYILFLCLPIIIVLYTAGSDFIRLWMGPVYETPSGTVLKILIIGYIGGLPQLIAHGILKGISMHKNLAYILAITALANLLISLGLARVMGINGVAIGTALPLLVANLIFIPFHTCKQLKIKFTQYLWESYSLGCSAFITISICYFYSGVHIKNYYELASYSICIAIVIAIIFYLFIVENDDRDMIKNKFKWGKKKIKSS